MFVNMHSLNRHTAKLFPMILLGLPFILFWRWVLWGEVLFWGAPLLQFWPWHQQVKTNLLSGQWPLWNPLLGNGAPLLANLQTAVFYPPNLLYLLMPVEHGLTLSVILHLGLAGVLMYFYTRQLGLTLWAATLSGLIFMFSGYLVGRTQFTSMINAAAWYPLLLLLSERLVIRRKQLDVLWLALALAIQLLAGHAQLWFYGLWLIGPYSLFRSWQTAPKPTNHPNLYSLIPLRFAPGTIVSNLSPLLRLAIAVSLALLLSAAQILPTAEYVGLSPRQSGAERIFALTYSFWPWRLLTLLTPNLFGHPAYDNYWGYANYWEDHAYLGVLPLLLALVACGNYLLRRVWGSRPQTEAASPPNKAMWQVVPFFAVLIPLSLILAMGWNTPIYLAVFDYVPGFSFFQAPARLLIWYTVAVAVLAGVGLHTFTLTPAGRRGWKRLLVLALGLVIAGLAANFILTGRSQTFGEATLRLGVGLAMSAGLLLACPRQPDSFRSPRAARRETLWQGAVLAFVAVDLLWTALPLNPTLPAAFFSQPIASAEFLKAQPGHYRFMVADQFAYDTKFTTYFRFQSFGPTQLEEWLKFKETLIPNLGVYANLASANNDDPLVVGRWQSLIEAIKKADTAQRARLLALMNTGYYLDAAQQVVWPPLYSTGPMVIQSVSEPLPRAYFVRRASDAADETAAIARLSRPDFDYRQEVIIMEVKVKTEPTAAPNDPAELAQLADVPVTILETQANRVVLSFNAPADGYIVLTDTFYPGWQADLDGRPAQILPANLAFRAVAVEAGQHTLVFDYQPTLFKLGLSLSAASLLGVIIAAVFLARPKSDGRPPTTDRR